MGGNGTQFSFPEAITTTNFLKILLEIFSVWYVLLLLTELFFKLGNTTYNPRFLVSFDKSEDPASASDKTRSLEPRPPASLEDTSAGQVTTASPGLAPVCLNQPDPGSFPFPPLLCPVSWRPSCSAFKNAPMGTRKKGALLLPTPCHFPYLLILFLRRYRLAPRICFMLPPQSFSASSLCTSEHELGNAPSTHAHMCIHSHGGLPHPH